MRQKPTKEQLNAMFLSELRTEYLKSDAYLRLALTTRKNYRGRLRRFLSYLPPDARIPDLTRQAIAKSLLRVSETSPTGHPMFFSAVRSFCLYLVAEGWLRADPSAGIQLPKVKKNRRAPVPEISVPLLIEAIDRLPRTEYRRDLARAAASLLIYAALRPSELAGMLVEDINLTTGELYIRKGKGGKTRTVYVCKECVDAVREFLKVRIDADHDYLLAYSRRYGMQPYAMRSLLRDMQRVAGISEHYTPHQLRHACASRLLHNGAPLTAIQEFLGHSRLETTFRYLHGNEEGLKAIAHLTSLNPKKEAETPKTAPNSLPAGNREEKRRRISLRRLR